MMWKLPYGPLRLRSVHVPLGYPFGPERLRKEALQDASAKVDIVVAAAENRGNASKAARAHR
jgi:hypothetical protein